MQPHLHSRHFYHDVPTNGEPGSFDEVFTFYLYDFGGNLTGFQQYRPLGDKTYRRNPREGKYFTHITPGKVGVWGLQYYYPSPTMVITEGVFKAVRFHNLGINAIAVLSNNPTHLKQQLQLLSLQYQLVTVVDPDTAGLQLAKYAPRYLLPPKPVDQLTDTEMEQLCKQLFTT